MQGCEQQGASLVRGAVGMGGGSVTGLRRMEGRVDVCELWFHRVLQCWLWGLSLFVGFDCAAESVCGVCAVGED